MEGGEGYLLRAAVSIQIQTYILDFHCHGRRHIFFYFQQKGAQHHVENVVALSTGNIITSSNLPIYAGGGLTYMVFLTFATDNKAIVHCAYVLVDVAHCLD